MSGSLIVPAYAEAKAARDQVDVLAARLSAARAGNLDLLNGMANNAARLARLNDAPLLFISASTDRVYFQNVTAAGSVSAAIDVWQTVVDISGAAGLFNGALLINTTAGSAGTGTNGLKITLDGVVFLIEKSPPPASSCLSTPLIDGPNQQTYLLPERVPFYSSLKIEVRRGINLAYNWAASYRLYP